MTEMIKDECRALTNYFSKSTDMNYELKKTLHQLTNIN